MSSAKSLFPDDSVNEELRSDNASQPEAQPESENLANTNETAKYNVVLRLISGSLLGGGDYDSVYDSYVEPTINSNNNNENDLASEQEQTINLRLYVRTYLDSQGGHRRI